MHTKRLIPLAVLALAVACTESASNPQENSISDGLKPQLLTVTENFDNAPTGAHYRQGFSAPTCIISGTSVSCGGTQIGGVGNTDADVALTVDFSATVRCRNNGGKIVDVKTQTTTTSLAPEDVTEVRNGTLIVNAFSNASALPTEQSFLDAATCPNPNWDKLLLAGTPAVTSFTYTLTFDGFAQPAIIVTGP